MDVVDLLIVRLGLQPDVYTAAISIAAFHRLDDLVRLREALSWPERFSIRPSVMLINAVLAACMKRNQPFFDQAAQRAIRYLDEYVTAHNWHIV